MVAVLSSILLTITSVKSHYQQLPQGWTVTRLSDIAWFGGGKTPSTENKAYWENGTVNWITSKDMKEPVITDSKIKLSTLGASQNTLYPKGTLLMVTRSGILRRTLPLAVIGKESTVNQDIKTINTPFGEISEFLYWYFSALEKEILEKYQKDGTTVESVDFERFQDIEIFLPPLSEQKRIIDQLKTLLHLIDVMSSDSVQIKTTIEKAKSKILDLAMQGKIVPQDPTDELAADMLLRINPKAKIITDNPHYPQLPDNWVLTKLGDVVKVINGKSQKEVENPSGSYPIYGSGGIIGMADTYSCLSGSTVIGRKGTINNPLFIETNFWNVDTAFGMKPYEGVDDLYFYYFCLSFDFPSLDKSSTLPSLTKSAIENITMPIPPLNEQHRIVSKIKEYDDLFSNIIKQLEQK